MSITLDRIIDTRSKLWYTESVSWRGTANGYFRSFSDKGCEVVTRMLKYFANKGMIKLSRGTIEIINEKKLEATTEG